MTSTDIANLALDLLNMDQIVSIDDNNARARSCLLHYQTCRDAFLCEYDWSFAKRGEMLVAMAEDTPPYCWAYACPIDMLKAIRVIRPGEYGRPGTLPFDIRMARDGVNRIIACDTPGVMVEYISSKSHLNIFSPLAIEALATRLAFFVGQAMKHEPTELQTLWQTYQAIFSGAVARDADNRSYPMRDAVRFNASRSSGLDALDLIPGESR